VIFTFYILGIWFNKEAYIQEFSKLV